MPGTRSTPGLLALGGIALAALLTVIGHVEVNDDLNPWALTISDFAVSDRGGVIDVAMVVLALATGGAAVRSCAAPTHPDPALPARAAELLLGAWWAGLLLAAAGADATSRGTAMTTAAYLHRYASVVAFLALPVGRLAARPAGPTGPPPARRYAPSSAAAWPWRRR